MTSKGALDSAASGLAAVAVAAVLLSGCSLKFASQSEILVTDSTQSAGTPNSTGNFTTTGSWDLKINWDCSKQRSEGLAGANGFAMTVYNADDTSTDSEHPHLQVQGNKGGRDLRFKRAGTFYVGVETSCDWNLKVFSASGTS